jgi:peptidoglycan biosynthesis protein MviN/MurJ (putative lipid II flippase)
VIKTNLSRLLKQIQDVWQKPALRSVAIITFFLFFSKALGLLRQIIIYQRMDRISSDLLLTASSLSDDVTSLLVMGTIFNAVLPVASRLEHEEGAKMNKYLYLMLLSISGLIGIISLLIIIFTRPILEFTISHEIFNDFANQGLLNDFIGVTRIIAITPLLLSVQSIFGVFLNLKKRFLIFSLAGVVTNLGMIIGLFVGGRNDYYSAAVGMVLGSFTTVLMYIIESRKFGLVDFNKFIIQTKQIFIELKDFWMQTWILFFPRIFLISGAVAANRIIKLVATEGGQITAFDISLSVQAAFFTIITSISTVFYPDLAKVFNDKLINPNIFWNKLQKYTELTAIISLVGGIATFVLAPIFVLIFSLFGKGQDNGNYIAYLAQICTLGFVFQAVSEILGKYFYVKERAWQPVLFAISALVVQVLATYSLIWSGADAGVAVSLGLVINFMILTAMQFWFIRRDYGLGMVNKRAV